MKPLRLICSILQIKTINKTKPFPPTKRERVYKLKITMQSNEEITDNEIFTFDDWLSYRVFYHIEDGVQQCNDSRNFTKLIVNESMSIDTLNKIQKEQSIVYEMMVNQELELLKSSFRIKYVRESIEPLEYLKMKIERVENNLKVTNKETYYDIISTRKVRGIKYGAKLISPSNYYHYNNIKVGRTKIRPDSYEGLIRENDVEGSNIYGNEWTFIEAENCFLQWLKRLQAGEFGFGYSDDNLIIELSTPAPMAEAQDNDKPDTSNLTLIEMFSEVSKYPTILKLLSDEGWSFPNTNVWIEQKTFLIRVLQNLYLKGYFIKKPTNNQYKAIALNTFNCDISIETIKRLSKPKIDEKDLTVIKLSTTI